MSAAAFMSALSLWSLVTSDSDGAHSVFHPTPLASNELMNWPFIITPEGINSVIQTEGLGI